MNKKIMILPVLALSISFNTATFAVSHMKDTSQCPCPKKKMERMAENFNLTDEQKKKIKELKAQAKKDMKDYHKQMKSLNAEMKALVKSKNIDEDKLNEVVNKKKDLVAAKMKAKIKMKNAIYNILNEQQKSKFMSMMDKWEKRKMDKMKKMDKNHDVTTDAMDND